MSRVVQLCRFSAICFAVAFVCASFTLDALAHPASFPSAQVKVDRSGRLELQVHFDLVAFVLGQAHSHIGDHATDHFLDAPDDDISNLLADAQARFADTLRIVCGNTEASIDAIVFPTIQDVHEIRQSLNTRHPSFMVDAAVLGSVPESAEQIAFGFSPSFDQLVLTVDRPGEAFHVEALESGQMSSALTLNLQAPWPSKLKSDAPMDYSARLTVDPSSAQKPPGDSFLIGILTSSIGITSIVICTTILVMLILILTYPVWKQSYMLK